MITFVSWQTLAHLRTWLPSSNRVTSRPRILNNVVFSKIKPYLPTKLQATAVEVLPEDACTFYMPNSGYDFNGSLVPHLTPMSFHGKLQYMQYKEEIKKYYAWTTVERR